jgi:hypothetical protein
VNAVHSSVVFDASYAPDILIFRFAAWPSLAEQRALLRCLIEDKHLGSQSSALINIVGVDTLPNPDDLAGSLAQAAANQSILQRVACVVASQKQAQFAETLRAMAPQPSRVRVFFTDDDALTWLRRPLG